MTEKLLAVIFVFIKSVIAVTGYGGIALLMAIESACIPLPSELIMPFAGYLVFDRHVQAAVGGDGGALGCNLGSLVAYEIGCYGGRPLVERYGRWILMGGANSTGRTAFSPAGDIWPCSSAAAAGDSHVHRAASGNCAHAAGTVSYLYVSGIVAVVPGAGIFRNEAG
jgi:hypothetical protein